MVRCCQDGRLELLLAGKVLQYLSKKLWVNQVVICVKVDSYEGNIHEYQAASKWKCQAEDHKLTLVPLESVVTELNHRELVMLSIEVHMIQTKHALTHSTLCRVEDPANRQVPVLLSKGGPLSSPDICQNEV